MTKLHTSTEGQPSTLTSSSSSMYGGEYAGLSATFSPTTGELIPVPEHYVPDSMIEWGQIPSCFEVVVSEENNDSSDNGNGVNDGVNRWTVQVMPEVGCGIDNLDTMKTKKYIPISNCGTRTSTTAMTNHDLGVSVSSVFIEAENRIECIFTNENHPSNVDNVNDKDGEKESGIMTKTRTRIGINLFPKNQQIKSPIDIVKEQKVSNKSSGGTIADGGGLDARTVGRLIGMSNINKPFSDGKGIDLEKEMVGQWAVYKNRHSDSSSGDDDATVVDRDLQYWKNTSADSDNKDNDHSTKTLSLPGNVIIRYSGSPLSTLEISFVVEEGNDGRIEMEQFQQPRRTTRVVMKRQLKHYPDSDECVISDAEYHWEEKI